MAHSLDINVNKGASDNGSRASLNYLHQFLMGDRLVGPQGEDVIGESP